MSEHRWSGWPGAVCMKCGTEDPREIALADGEVDFVGDAMGVVYKYPEKIAKALECPVADAEESEC